MKRSTIAIIGVVIIVIAAAVALASGSKNNSNSSSNNSNTSNSDQNQPNDQNNSQTNPTSTNSVSIAGMAFNPSDITVKKGTTVTWSNNDNMTHTVQETDGKKGPNSSDLAPGDKYSFTFDETGTFAYHCSIHPSMSGSVVVTQ
jgi:plastocyanin